MAQIIDYLNQLLSEKHALVEALKSKGVECSDTETFTTLIPKVLLIETQVTPSTPDESEDSDPIIPDQPGDSDGSEESDGPEAPDEPTINEIGSLTASNTIELNDNAGLPSGEYTLKYIDADGNPIENFKDITKFTL